MSTANALILLNIALFSEKQYKINLISSILVQLLTIKTFFSLVLIALNLRIFKYLHSN